VNDAGKDVNDEVKNPQYQRLTLFLRSRDHARHHSLATEIFSRARRAGLAGATMFQGVDGLGQSGTKHHSRLLVDDVPVRIVMVDTRQRLDGFRSANRQLLSEVVVVVEDVQAFRA
jgi:PII-like signaling protein